MKYSLILFVLLNIFARQSSGSRQGRIVGGQDVSEGDYPFMVSIQALLPGYPWLHYCGGSIIHPRFILTQAFCLNPIYGIENVNIRVGSVYWKTGGIQVPTQKWIPHERWNATVRYGNDIGLIKLAEPLPLGPLVNVIELDTFPMFDSSESLTTLGWGKNTVGEVPLGPPEGDPEDNLTPRLQSLTVRSVPWGTCRKLLSGFEDRFRYGQVCAVNGSPNKAVCSFDLGAPLIRIGKLAGILSWRSGGCDGDQPDVWTSVPFYRNWIRRNIQRELNLE